MERGRAERAAFLGPEQKAWAMSGMTLRVAHLYPRLMNIYGDRGNIMCLRRRCEARGIEFELMELGMGERLDPSGVDLIFAGGAQDREQRNVVDDLLATKADAVREAVEAGVVLLAVCGAYQLFGRFYRESTGVELQGVGIFDLHTEHPGEKAKRLIGNIVVDWERAEAGLRDGERARGRVPLQGGVLVGGVVKHGGGAKHGAGGGPGAAAPGGGGAVGWGSRITGGGHTLGRGRARWHGCGRGTGTTARTGRRALCTGTRTGRISTGRCCRRTRRSRTT